MSDKINKNEKTAFESSEYILPPYTPEEEREAFARLKAGDELAEEDITMHNMKLLIDTSNKFIKKTNLYHCDRDDVQAAAYLGLHKAIYGFDPGKGNKFSTYAVTCMIRTMQKERQSFDPYWTMKPKQFKAYMAAQEYISSFEAECGRRPSEDELMKALKCKRDTAVLFLSEKPSVFSYDAPASEGSETSRLELIAGEVPSPEEEAILRSLGDTLRLAVNEVLDPKEREVVCRFFGLYGEPEKLCVIGRDFDVSAQFIHKLKDRAVAKLAEALRDYKD